jgi:hypothetical protein
VRLVTNLEVKVTNLFAGLALRITVRIWKNALPVALPRFGPIYFSLPANAIPDSYMSSTSFQLALHWFSTNGLVYYSFKGYIFIMDYVNHVCSSFED